ncbi:MAG: transposase [Proteobacteria bacterium]|nr:transposase [Pseudomonadota bacterium]MBU1583976.1 transposase [Pseudomonadota bacterium]MBU2455370.1 transposase [Pseudomonadota bacterium]MBU2632005.1 transposase [Pseudomonadota bacterium]
MSFKCDNQMLSFSDLELSQKKTKNNTLNHLETLDQSIQWDSIEAMLLENYPIGKKKKGPQAYSPLMLLKCLLLRNWFQIPSDAALESLVNDRISFKKFAGLPVGEPAPSSSTFSRFKNRLSLETCDMVMSDISDQLACQNIIIHMGLAMDIQIIKSDGPPETRI